MNTDGGPFGHPPSRGGHRHLRGTLDPLRWRCEARPPSKVPPFPLLTPQGSSPVGVPWLSVGVPRLSMDCAREDSYSGVHELTGVFQSLTVHTKNIRAFSSGGSPRASVMFRNYSKVGTG